MDYLFGFTNVDFSFSVDLSVRIPESGFLLQIGQTGNDFYDAISFSGRNGYIFDRSGDMVGGYIKNQPFNISGNCSYGGNNGVEATGRLSYYLDGVLISNNMYSTGFVDTIRFEGYTNDNMGIISVIPATGSFDALMDSDGYYILSNEGNFLIAKT